jgi:hypothetical protein
MPNIPIQKTKILEAIGKRAFLLSYSLSDMKTVIGLPSLNSSIIKNEIESLIPGMEMRDTNLPMESTRFELLVAYRLPGETGSEWFEDIFSTRRVNGSIIVAVIPVYGDALERAKRKIETNLGDRAMRHTVSSQSSFMGTRASMSVQTENFKESEEAMMLTDLLDATNAAILKNGTAYKIAFLLSGDIDKLDEFISNRLLVMSKCSIKAADLRELVEKLKKTEIPPFGIKHVISTMHLNWSNKLNYLVRTMNFKQQDGLPLGTYMKDSVHDTKLDVQIDPSTLNLGLMVSGLPGSGKTSCAMSILDSAMRFSNQNQQVVRVAIISPTDEWNSFALKNKLNLVSLYDGMTSINFFKCPDNLNKELFYEDLAMIISSVSGAGPYENPLNKCLINAFRSAYADSYEPDPVEVYEKIEESILKFHAKRNNTGVKYTKHGENIRSALENLRSIIARPEYSSKEGIAIDEVIQKGVVFDLSNLSNSAKPYMYALLLNQIYAQARAFGLENDDKLNLIICIEEAQLVFREKESTASIDLKQRIQDFRKQGVCLMLLCHNVTDIDPIVRRLCQTKLYLKQAADVAPVAAKDLIFTYAEDEEVIMKLKHLDSRVGALTCVQKQGMEKVTNDTVFVRTKEFNKPAAQNVQEHIKHKKQWYLNSEITVAISDNWNPHKVRIYFIGEEILEFQPVPDTPVCVKLLPGRRYAIEFLNEKGRVIWRSNIIARRKIVLQPE